MIHTLWTNCIEGRLSSNFVIIGNHHSRQCHDAFKVSCTGWSKWYILSSVADYLRFKGICILQSAMYQIQDVGTNEKPKNSNTSFCANYSGEKGTMLNSILWYLWCWERKDLFSSVSGKQWLYWESLTPSKRHWQESYLITPQLHWEIFWEPAGTQICVICVIF